LLAERGWQVRGTSRSDDGVAKIEREGLDGARFDPDLPANLLELVGDVSAVVWLLGSAEGPPEQIEAIHGPRLERLLEKLVDTPVRGFAYEVAGTAPAASLEAGRAAVERAAEIWRIPVTFLEGARDEGGWAEGAAGAVSALLLD
jgi:hypothetical protein